MTKEEQILKYYYIHVSGGVIEKHIDIILGQILTNESKADLIVAVVTGEVPYVAIAGSFLLIMIAITSEIYVIKKKHQ